MSCIIFIQAKSFSKTQLINNRIKVYEIAMNTTHHLILNRVKKLPQICTSMHDIDLCAIYMIYVF